MTPSAVVAHAEGLNDRVCGRLLFKVTFCERGAQTRGEQTSLGGGEGEAASQLLNEDD
jgi:hypothetical protein